MRKAMAMVATVVVGIGIGTAVSLTLQRFVFGPEAETIAVALGALLGGMSVRPLKAFFERRFGVGSDAVV